LRSTRRRRSHREDRNLLTLPECRDERVHVTSPSSGPSPAHLHSAGEDNWPALRIGPCHRSYPGSVNWLTREQHPQVISGPFRTTQD
jgi:hypothetical protein